MTTIYNIRLYARHLHKRWVEPFIYTRQISTLFSLYRKYLSDWSKYSKLEGSEPLHFTDSYPCLLDRTATTHFDAHYFYQSVWAAQAIKASGAQEHVDIGSLALFVGMLTAIVKVTFVDIRPLTVNLENFNSREGSILALPFDDNSILSLSCLHVAEHIGLGRYGDPLDPKGTEKAARELARVLSPGGNLYFSLPVGRERVCFNAHRIHSPRRILDYFYDLELVEFSAIDDHKNFRRNISPHEFSDAKYACGLFHFTKPY